MAWPYTFCVRGFYPNLDIKLSPYSHRMSFSSRKKFKSGKSKSTLKTETVSFAKSYPEWIHTKTKLSVWVSEWVARGLYDEPGRGDGRELANMLSQMKTWARVRKVVLHCQIWSLFVEHSSVSLQSYTAKRTKPGLPENGKCHQHATRFFFTDTFQT